MAAPTDAGFGLGVHDGKAVHEHEKDGARKLGLSAEDPIGFDDKNEDEEDEEEAPVAKKARVEKADNGVDDDDGDDDDDEGSEGFAEKDADETELDPLLGHDNGAAESPVEGDADDDDDDDDENGGVGAADDDDDDESAEVDVAPAKDTPGDAGLRTLLHEGDAKTNLLNGAGADLHTLNGAK